MKSNISKESTYRSERTNLGLSSVSSKPTGIDHISRSSFKEGEGEGEGEGSIMNTSAYDYPNTLVPLQRSTTRKSLKSECDDKVISSLNGVGVGGASFITATVGSVGGGVDAAPYDPLEGENIGIWEHRIN